MPRALRATDLFLKRASKDPRLSKEAGAVARHHAPQGLHPVPTVFKEPNSTRIRARGLLVEAVTGPD